MGCASRAICFKVSVGEDAVRVEGNAVAPCGIGRAVREEELGTWRWVHLFAVDIVCGLHLVVNCGGRGAAWYFAVCSCGYEREYFRLGRVPFRWECNVA